MSVSPDDDGPARPEIVVRRARVADAPALADVHVRVWRWAYRGLMPEAYLEAIDSNARRQRRTERWRDDLAADWLSVWVAEITGTLSGFAGAVPVSRDQDVPPGTAELVMINVLEEYAGRGVGRALLAAVEQYWHRIGAVQAVLWVLAGNDRALAAYEHLGWVADGARGDYAVGDLTLEQLRMRKRLAEA